MLRAIPMIFLHCYACAWYNIEYNFMRNEADCMSFYFAQEAAEVVRVLEGYGFEAYYVGGCVRDNLLGVVPKDFDVTTNAMPEQVIECFSS